MFIIFGILLISLFSHKTIKQINKLCHAIINRKKTVCNRLRAWYMSIIMVLSLDF